MHIGTALQTSFHRHDLHALDNTVVYYQTVFPTGPTPPTLQKNAYPTQQTGSLATGSFGLAWHDVIVSRRGNTVNWLIASSSPPFPTPPPPISSAIRN